MKKKILTTLLAAALLVSGVSVFAEEAADTSANETAVTTIGSADEATEINVSLDDVAAQRQTVPAKYTRAESEIKEIKDGKVITVKAEDGTESDITVADDAVVLDLNGGVKKYEDLKAGDKVYTFVTAEKNAAVSVIVIKDEKLDVSVDVDTYVKSEMFGVVTNIADNLALNLDENSDITDLEGNKVAYTDLEHKDLAVFFNMVALSMPGQTTPIKVVVLGESDYNPVPSATPEVTPAPTEAPDFTKVTKLIAAGKEIGAVSYDSEIKTVLVPVRAVAEAFGYDVSWDGDLRAVTVGTVQMGVNFRIGENSYKKSKMTPFVLETAPVIINDYTYVPLSFFSDVLEADVTVSDTELKIDELIIAAEPVAKETPAESEAPKATEAPEATEAPAAEK